MNKLKKLICEYCGKLLKTTQKSFCCRRCSAVFRASNPTDATRKKLSDNVKGKNNPMYGVRLTGEDNPFYGKHHTDKSKQMMSDTRQGMYVGENNPFYGKHHTDETKNKIREGNARTRCNYAYDPSAPQPEYRRKAIETYGYVCSGCGCTDGVLYVHHLDGNHYNDDISNLAVLCPGCHNKIHKNNFRGDSTPDEEFTKFVVESRDRRANHD